MDRVGRDKRVCSSLAYEETEKESAQAESHGRASALGENPRQRILGISRLAIRFGMQVPRSPGGTLPTQIEAGYKRTTTVVYVGYGEAITGL